MVSEWEGLKGEQKNNFSKQRTPYGKLAKKKIGTAWSKFKIDLSPSCDKVTCLILGGWSLHTSITCYIRWVNFFMTEYVVTAYTTRSALKKNLHHNFVRSFWSEHPEMPFMPVGRYYKQEHITEVLFSKHVRLSKTHERPRGINSRSRKQCVCYFSKP